MKIRIHFILIMMLLLATAVSGKTFRKVGTSAAQFLKIGVGARALALGGAFGALANDASTVYWNPAGMITLDKIAWTGSHTKWFADINHQFTALVIPFSGSSSALGLSATFITMGEEEITTETSPRGTGFFWDANDIAVGISYARWMTNRFALGITMKYISQNIYNESASTVAVDVGTYLRTGYKGIIIGMSFSNFGGTLKLSGRDLIRPYDPNPANTLSTNVDSRLYTEPWPLPVNFRVAIAMELVGATDGFFSSFDNRLTLAIDGLHPNDDTEKLNLGFEYSWREMFFARLGYGTGYDLNELAYGGGLKFGAAGSIFTFDYAFAPYGELDNIHHFTIGLEF
ncbi:MAG TPA: PorV/PorQ family protein [bacterium]|nr:PorV/PorQ family protein [bacterium]